MSNWEPPPVTTKKRTMHREGSLARPPSETKKREESHAFNPASDTTRRSSTRSPTKSTEQSFPPPPPPSNNNATLILLGFDGAGKTTLARALAKPNALDAAAEVLLPTHLQLMVEGKKKPDARQCFESSRVDDTLIAQSVQRTRSASTGGSYPSALRMATASGGTRSQSLTTSQAHQRAARTRSGGILHFELMDTSGSPNMRVLWPMFFVNRGPIAAQDGPDDFTDPQTAPSSPSALQAAKIPPVFAEQYGAKLPSAVLYVIDAHDPIRLHSSWSELVTLVNDADVSSNVRKVPLCVVLVTYKAVGVANEGSFLPSFGSIDTAALLKAVQDFAVLSHPNWSVVEVDCSRVSSGGEAATPVSHRRRGSNAGQIVPSSQRFEVDAIRPLVDWIVESVV